MNIRNWLSLMVGASAMALLSAAPGLAATQNSGSASAPCTGTDIVIVYSPNTLWPPNHKMQRITIVGVDNASTTAQTANSVGDNDGESFTIAVNPANNTESPNEGRGLGCGNVTTQGPDSAPDNDPNFPPMATATDPSTATAYWDLRAERCAAEGSRTYTIDVHCTEMPTMSNPMGEMASGDATLTITVPHDQGNHTGQP